MADPAPPLVTLRRDDAAALLTIADLYAPHEHGTGRFTPGVAPVAERVREAVAAAGKPAGPLVMPQDEYELTRWVFELTGGPAFPANAATACRIAARMNAGGNGEVFARLAEAIGGARNAPGSTLPSSVPDDTGQDSPATPEQARERTWPLLPLDRDGLQEIVSNAVANWSTGAPSDRITGALWPLLEHAQSAAEGSHEGIRLWMLDCGLLVQKHREHAAVASARLGEQRERAEVAEAKLAAERRAFHGILIRFAAEAVRGKHAYGLPEDPAFEALRRIGVDLKKAADEMAAADLRGEAAPPSGMQDPAPVVRVIGEEQGRG